MTFTTKYKNNIGGFEKEINNVKKYWNLKKCRDDLSD